MAPVVTLPSVSASYSMASTFTERSGHMEEVLIKQKNNTSGKQIKKPITILLPKWSTIYFKYLLLLC